jgi:uncharacterized protein
MQETMKIKQGRFCWVELSTIDIEAAKKFYGEILGLECEDHSMPEWTYWMFKKGDKFTGGLTNLPQKVQDAGAPPHWMNYVAVDDTEATFKKAVELGAIPIVQPMEVPAAGKMAVFLDLEGAAIALWQSTKPDEDIVRNFPGCFCWQEYAAADADKSIEFYKSVFGYDHQSKSMGDMDYTTFMLDDNMEAGLYPKPETMKDVPSHWLTYFKTDDIDGLVAKVPELGGEVIFPITEFEGVGRVSILKDPQGAFFGVVQ